MLLQFPGEDITSPFMFSFLDVCLCLCRFVFQSFGMVVLIRMMIYLMLYMLYVALINITSLYIYVCVRALVVFVNFSRI